MRLKNRKQDCRNTDTINSSTDDLYQIYINYYVSHLSISRLCQAAGPLQQSAGRETLIHLENTESHSTL